MKLFARMIIDKTANQNESEVFLLLALNRACLSVTFSRIILIDLSCRGILKSDTAANVLCVL